MTDETPGAYVLAPGRPRRRFPWLRRRLTLEPYQVGIVIRDGRVEEVFAEGARRLPRGEVRTHVASTAPFNLVFWLKDPGDPSEPDEGIALDQPVLTSDSQLVTGRIDLTLSVVPDNAERLLQLPRSRGVVTPADVGDAIRAELLAKVLALDIHRHSAGDLRGNRDLFKGIGASLETELASTIARYGLNLDNFYVNWGLTHEERERIEEQQHESAIRDIERKKELEEAENGPPTPPKRTSTVRPDRGGWVPLSKLDPQAFDAAPVEISFPNDERAALTAWTSVQLETVRWLARQGMLKGPVPGRQPDKLYVNRTPYHSDGSPFPEAAEVGGWYTPKGMDGRDVVGKTVRIVEHIDQDPSEFQVRFAVTGETARHADPGGRESPMAARRSRRVPKIVAAALLVGAFLVAAAVMRPGLEQMLEAPNTPAPQHAAAIPGDRTSTPTATATPADTPIPTATAAPTATSRSAGSSVFPTPRPRARAVATVLPRRSATPTPTYTPTPTATPTPTYTPTPTPTNTPEPTPTVTPRDANVGVLLWRFNVNVPVASSPVVAADGVVYLASSISGWYGTNTLHALDSLTGERLWVSERYRHYANPSYTSPDVSGRSAYWTRRGSGGYVYLYVMESGEMVWRVLLDSSVVSSPTVADGIVYIGLDDRLHARYASSGEFLWSYATNGAVRSSPAVSDGVVYVGSDDNRVYALDAESGEPLWEYATNGSVRTTPAASSGVVYVGSQDNHVYALNAATGEMLWRYRTSVGDPSSPAVADGVVYVGATDKHVHAVDASTGDMLWRFETGDAVHSSPVVVDSVVYIGSDDNHLYALDAATGTMLWQYRTGDHVRSSPAVAGGIVYVGSSDGYLYAIRDP